MNEIDKRQEESRWRQEAVRDATNWYEPIARVMNLLYYTDKRIVELEEDVRSLTKRNKELQEKLQSLVYAARDVDDDYEPLY